MYSWSWNFHFFITAFLWAVVGGLPTADLNINMTILVPAGTSDHGDPNLLCTPIKWLDVLIFFLANYFAHAATVKALPGETAQDFAFTVFLAISFPFSGVSRGLEAIIRYASYYRNASNDNAKNDLQTAVRAGALCVVVRDEHWRCQPSDPGYPNYPNLPPEISDAHPREEMKGNDIKDDQESGTIPVLRVERFKGKYELEYVTSRKVHGLPQLPERLPEGYRLALLPSNTEVIPNYDPGGSKKIILSSSYSIPQVIIAIVQALYASYTLYKTRGDQLNRYGYAAFGLTVIPYIIMSFLNLLGNLLTPDYPTLYLVSSPELKEAVSRGATIDGVVGMVSEVNRRRYRRDRTIPECSRWKTDGTPYRRPKRLGFSGFLWWAFVVVFLGTIPYAVIGSLTHFRAGQSTPVQRVLTMFWLASGVFIGAAIPFYSFNFHEMKDILKAWANIETMDETRARTRLEARFEAKAEAKAMATHIDSSKSWAIIEYKDDSGKVRTRTMINDDARGERARIEYKIRAEHAKARESTRAEVKARARLVLMFLASLVFGTSAMAGFVIVGQMLREYGLCTLLS